MRPASAGWNVTKPRFTQSFAPLISVPTPGTIGSSSRISAASPIVYV